MPDQSGIATYAERFAEALNEKFPVVETWDDKYAVVEGKRFDKIVKQRPDGSGGPRVHAFVEKHTGLLIKAAGWNAPAKLKGDMLNSKWNLADDAQFAGAVEAADPYGAYLYAGTIAR